MLPILPSISILQHTSSSYSEWIYKQLGKGRDHAILLYEEWFRTGRFMGESLAFGNAARLKEEMVALTDFSILPLKLNISDGQTSKFLLSTAEGFELESVLIPMQAGGTLCISSQVGCRMGCSFCETGRMGLVKNLTTTEILSQLFTARFILGHSVRNIVFMGMGEPFDNYEEVLQAYRVLTDPSGFGFGSNHITISTSGRVDGILKLLEERGSIPNLAVSLNAPNNALRKKLMPITRTYPLEILYDTLKTFCTKTRKEVLIAYVLIAGQNDTLEHADELALFLKGLAVKVNLIPYNPQSHDKYSPPSQEQIDAFAQRLRFHHYRTLIRQKKGQKIMAACGQLGNLELKRRLSP